MKAPVRKQGENAVSIQKRREVTPGSRLGACMGARNTCVSFSLTDARS